MPALPALLVVTAALGYHFTTTNPFNPLQLQNPATWQPQIRNIAGYYAACCRSSSSPACSSA